MIWQEITTHFQDIPAILTGDFNAEPDSKTYRWLTGHSDEAVDTFPDFKETFKSPYPGTCHKFTGKSITGLIDWILYRGNLRFENCLVIEDSFDGMFPSDHFPVMAYFEV